MLTVRGCFLFLSIIVRLGNGQNYEYFDIDDENVYRFSQAKGKTPVNVAMSAVIVDCSRKPWSARKSQEDFKFSLPAEMKSCERKIMVTVHVKYYEKVSF